MRRFASDLFTARGIDFRFQAPDGEGDLTVGANVRRELYLIFKEAVNNSGAPFAMHCGRDRVSSFSGQYVPAGER